MGAEEGKNGQCEASSNHLYQTSLPQPQSMPFELQVLLLWMRICTARHATCERRNAFTHDQYMSVEGRSIIAVRARNPVYDMQLHFCRSSMLQCQNTFGMSFGTIVQHAWNLRVAF